MNTKRVLKKNTVVKINGIPLRILEEVMVESNDKNFDSIKTHDDDYAYIDEYGGVGSTPYLLRTYDIDVK